MGRSPLGRTAAARQTRRAWEGQSRRAPAAASALKRPLQAGGPSPLGQVRSGAGQLLAEHRVSAPFLEVVCRGLLRLEGQEAPQTMVYGRGWVGAGRHTLEAVRPLERGQGGPAAAAGIQCPWGEAEACPVERLAQAREAPTGAVGGREGFPHAAQAVPSLALVHQREGLRTLEPEEAPPVAAGLLGEACRGLGKSQALAFLGGLVVEPRQELLKVAPWV